MAIPMVASATVFDAAAATATVDLTSTLSQHYVARSIHLEINGGSTPSWALDIQGRVSPSATWHNIDYFRTDQGAAVTPSASQLTVNWTTAQHYVIPNPPPFIRLVGTRTGGTLTVYASFSSEAYSVPFTTVVLGAGTALGGKVGIDQTTPGTTNNVTLSPGGVAGTSPSVDASTAAEDNRVVKASAGTLYGFTVNSTTAQYIQIHNTAALPGALAVPFLTFPIAANETIVVSFGEYGKRCSTGITIANSTTQQTWTDGGDDCLFNVDYK